MDIKFSKRFNDKAKEYTSTASGNASRAFNNDESEWYRKNFMFRGVLSTASSSISCGVGQLYSISRVKTTEINEEFLSMVYYRIPKEKFLLFSDTKTSGGGKRMSDWIIKNKLGSVVMMGQGRNPNTNNIIQVYCWDIDHMALIKWRVCAIKSFNKLLT